jgi:Flp pilus assembly protein TadB
MNHAHRTGERQVSNADSKLSHTIAYAALGSILGAIALLLWLQFGWYALAFIGCFLGAALLARLMAKVELKRMIRELEYQRRTPYEAGVGQVGQKVGQNLDVEA